MNEDLELEPYRLHIIIEPHEAGFLVELQSTFPEEPERTWVSRHLWESWKVLQEHLIETVAFPGCTTTVAVR